MKDAEANDAYRRINESRKAWKNRVAALSIKDYEGIREFVIDFTVGVTALVGGNGSGKTRVLSALHLALAPAANIPDLQITLSDDFDGVPNATLINAAEKVEIYKSYFKKLDDIEENLLNGIEAYEVNAAELSEIRYILCRNYSSVKFFETEPSLRVVENDDREDAFSSDIIPFFVVSEGGNSWDSRSMGSGEYAPLYIWWALRGRNAGEIVLIEEPETYLSHVVQERMANHLAKFAWDKKVSLIISTHSYPFIAKLPEDSIKPLLRRGSGTSLAKRGKQDILSAIGAAVSLRAICLVEDKMAKYFLEFFIETFFPSVSGKIVVCFMQGAQPSPKTGASGVASFLESARHVSNLPFSIIGVFDGDQVNEPTYKAAGLENSFKCLLPGPEPLDSIFTDICRRHIEQTSRIDEGFSRAFELHEGANYHDHLRKACSDVGVALEEAWKFCFPIWVQEQHAAVEELKGALNVVFKSARVL